MLLDLTDLLHHHLVSKAPTGIQRVQGEVATCLLEKHRAAMVVRLVCHVTDSVGWVEVPRRLLAELIAINASGGGDGAWRLVQSGIHAVLAETARRRLPKGAVVVNLGASWCLPNYLLAIRDAQAAYEVRYMPFVHDCIPILRPDLCVPGLPEEFLGWLAGAGLVADGLLTSTASTATHVRAALAALGIESPPIGVVSLEANPRLAAFGGTKHPIVPNRPYVLFVSTLEGRKGHALVFRVWLELARRHKQETLPRLICVGKPGWQNQDAYALFAREPTLSDLVTIVSEIDDAALAALYTGCLCTLYPSLLEGWGLPVTEALSFGKIPIVARTTGLMEAAGAFGEYFAPGALAELVAAVERVCFDVAYRAAAESRIRMRFRPRSVEAMADTFADEIAIVAARPRRLAASRCVGAGRYFAFGCNRLAAPGPDVPLGEHMRRGTGWLTPEYWGCLTRPGPAAFVLPVRMERGPMSLVIGLCNPGDVLVSVVISAAGASALHQMHPGQTQWVGLVLNGGASSDAGLQVVLHSTPVGSLGRARWGVGVVGAMVSHGGNIWDHLRLAAARKSEIANAVLTAR